MNNQILILKIKNEIEEELLQFFNLKNYFYVFTLNKDKKIKFHNDFIRYFQDKLDILMYQKHRTIEDFIKIKICKEEIEKLKKRLKLIIDTNIHIEFVNAINYKF